LRMKLILLLAVVGLGYASFCENESAFSIREIVKPLIVNQLEDIFGHCKAFKNLLKKEFKSRKVGDCSRYFDELYCFGQKKMDELVEPSVEDLTYIQMSKFIGENGDGRMLAQKSCNHGLPCLEKVVKVMAGCAKRDSTFWDQSILIVEEKLSSEMVQNVISEMIGSMETDDPFRMLVERIQSRITSYDDLKAIIDEHIPAETQENIIAGAKRGLHNFIQRAKGFCKNGCLEKSADYFEDGFMATHDDDTCPSIRAYGYCGGCQDNMEEFITGNDVPCCTQTAVVNIAEAIKDTIDSYYELFKQKEAEVIDAISDIVPVEGIETYEFIQARIREQALCLKETYGIFSEEECAVAA